MKRILENDKYTFLFLLGFLAFFIATFTFILYTLSNNFYCCHTDDVIQYFTIMEEFTLKVKSGTLSFYNFGNYLGASFFADTYYIPADLFTLIILVLSYFMQFEFAFAMTEMLKMAFGVMLFFAYLKMRKYQNKTSLYGALLYLVMGGNVVLMAFPCYYSVVFYLPLSLIALEYFLRGKKIVLTPVVALLVFYNYYFSYSILIFMGIIYLLRLIEKYHFKDLKTQFKDIMLNILSFLGLAILGIFIASIFLIPSALYVLNDTYRTPFEYSLWTFKNGQYFDQYIRILAKIFVPSFPTSYYGFQNNYIKEHFSLYITVSGFLCFMGVYSNKDRLSNIYKVIIPLEAILLAFPIFYMIFSGNTAPYGRWMVFLDALNILILVHTLEKTNFRPNMHSLGALIRNGVCLAVLVLVLNYYFERMFYCNIFEALIKEAKGEIFEYNKSLWSFNFLRIDIIMMFIALGIIATVTALSFIKKFNIIPLALTLELIIGMVFICYIPVVYKDDIDIAQDRSKVNEYLDKYFPYNNQFQRIYVNKEVGLGEARNFDRTNMQMTNLSIFHSFYDAKANDYSKILYGTSEDAGKRNADSYSSIFTDQILGRKYLILKSNTEMMLPTYYEYLAEYDDGKYAAYQAKGASPFTIYNTKIADLEAFGNKSSSYLLRQAYMLNNLYFDASINNNYDLDLDSVTKDQLAYKTVRRFYESGLENPWDSIEHIDGKEFLGYYLTSDDVSLLEDGFIPDEGIMHLYYPINNTQTYTVDTNCQLDENYIGYEYYEDNVRKIKKIGRCTERYCYYDKTSLKKEASDNKMMIFIKNTADMTKKSPQNLVLGVEYGTLKPYDDYLSKRDNYDNLKAVINKEQITVSFTRKSLEKIVVCLPITYNSSWTIDNQDFDILNVNGGLLGIVIDSNNLDISFSLSFKVKGLKESVIISAISSCIYGIYTVYYFKIKEDFEVLKES